MSHQPLDNTEVLQALGVARVEAALDIMNQLTSEFATEDSQEVIDLTSQFPTEQDTQSSEVIDLTSQIVTKQDNERNLNSQMNDLLDGIDFTQSLTPSSSKEVTPIWIPSTYPENEDDEITCIPSTYPEENGPVDSSQDLFPDIVDENENMDQCSFTQLLDYVEENEDDKIPPENISGDTLPFTCMEEKIADCVQENLNAQDIVVQALSEAGLPLNNGEECDKDSDEGIEVDSTPQPILQPFICEDAKSPEPVSIYQVRIFYIFFFKIYCP